MPKKNEGRVTVERNGKQYSAAYTLEKGVITVRTVYARKSTQLGSSSPEVLAKLILSEMIDAGEA